MTPDLSIDFAVNKKNNTITIKRYFNAKLSLVWDAFTVAEILDKWWAPKPWKSKTKSMNFSEGGKRFYAMVGPEGEEHWGLTTYEIIQPRILFSGLDEFCDKDGNLNTELPKSYWETKFKVSGIKTVVEIKTTYSDAAQLEAMIQMGFKEGLTKAMEELDRILSTANANN